MSVQLVCYDGRPAALVTSDRLRLVGGFEELPEGHPLLRFVVYMALYARDLVSAQSPRRYRDEDAERLARLALIDPADLEGDQSDEELAERLRMPVEQVVAARAELAAARD